jgi:2-oxoacid:acceptor oxidoreductase gamma subunit (pyruvate/2-ketoisovalerate family)
MKQKDYEYEVIFIGRGGQGVVTAAQLLGETLFLEGYNDAVVIPTFGPERRGAPVKVALRFSYAKIYKFSQPDNADYLFFLDESLFDLDTVSSFLKKDTCIIVNSKTTEILSAPHLIYKFPVTKVSLNNKLIVQGAPVVNTPMLGVIAKLTGIISLANIEKVIYNNFKESVAEKNMETIKKIFDLAKKS